MLVLTIVHAHLEVIGFVISVHVLGMFAFSPMVGAAVDRWGRGVMLACGGIILLTSLVLCSMAPPGNSWEIWSGLFLLGLGWSFATVAGSTVLADLSPVASRTDVQGTGDMTMSLVAAGGGALSGLIVAGPGFPALAAFSAALASVVLGAGVLIARHAR